jgi:hypothetical protein
MLSHALLVAVLTDRKVIILRQRNPNLPLFSRGTKYEKSHGIPFDIIRHHLSKVLILGLIDLTKESGHLNTVSIVITIEVNCIILDA